MVIFVARVRRVQFGQLLKHGTPSLGLFFGVLDVRQRIAAARDQKILLLLHNTALNRTLEMENKKFIKFMSCVLFVIQSCVGQIFPSSPVHGIRESGMIGVQFGAVRKYLIRVLVQVSDPQRKPRYVFCETKYRKII